MMRNLKVLGLALVAMFALSAAAASMASADDLTAEKYPVTLTGDQDNQTDIFTTTAGTVSCKKVGYVGTIAGATTEATATPTYSECTALGFPGTIHMNGCTYKFKIGASGSTTSTVDIVCPAGQEITVTSIAAGTTKCVIHVPAQTGLTHVNWTNVAGPPKDVTADIEITNLKYTHTALGTGLGACTGGSASNGKYVGKATVTGEEDGSPFAAVGIFFS
jgi:hypothetical protein